MSQALNEKPNAEPSLTSAGAGVISEGRYLSPPNDEDGKLWIRTSALIRRDANDLYRLWHDVENIPLWQERISQVTRTGEKTSHWVMRKADKNDKGEILEWDSEILADEPGRRITWRSTGGDVQTAGEVIFEPSPGGGATMVTVLQQFRMGKLANAWETIVARSPKQAVIENVRHFKALAETGEIPRIEGQPHGPRGAVAGMKESAYGEKIETPPGLERKAS